MLDTKEILLLVLLGIIFILLIWILVIRNKYKRDFDKLNNRLHTETDNEIQERTIALLRLIIMPLQWAVRAALMEENLVQVEQYINQYVKEPGIDYIALVGKDGIIQIASDKKTEQKLYSEVFPEEATGLEKIQVIKRLNDEKLIIAPVAGLNENMGTIVLVYHPKSV